MELTMERLHPLARIAAWCCLLSLAHLGTSAESSPPPPGATASRLPGVKDDLDFANRQKVGGGVPTDNRKPLNAYLATATAATPAILDLDRPMAVRGALVIPATGHVVIEGHGWDTGLYSLPGSNDCTIRMADSPMFPFDPGPAKAPPIVQGNLAIRHLKIDGGRGVYPKGNVDSAEPGFDARGRVAAADGPIYTGIDLVGVREINLDDVWVYDPCTFAVRINQADSFKAHGCRLESPTQPPSRGYNTDGFHLNSVSDVRISDCSFLTGDDAIALNNDEGFGTGRSSLCVVDNCTFQTCQTGIRVMGIAVGTSHIVASNLTGSIRWYLLNVGVEQDPAAPPNTAPSMNTDIRIANSTLTFTERYGSNLSGSGLVWLNGSSNIIELDGVTVLASVQPHTMLLGGHVGQVDSIVVRAKAVRNAAGNAPVNLMSASAGAYGTIRIDGFKVEDLQRSSYASAPYLFDLSGSAHIDKVWIGDVDSAHVGAFTNDFSRFGSIGGPGVAATGWAFPDEVIAAGTLYYSSTQSALCYKGADESVQRLTATAVPAMPRLRSSGVFARVANGAFAGGQGAPLVAASNPHLQLGRGSWTMGSFISIASTPGYGMMAMSKWGRAPADQEYLLGWFNGPAAFSVVVNDGTTVHQLDGTTHPAIGSWYFVVAQFDATAGRLHLFVNDQEEGKGADGVACRSTSQPLVLGGADEADPSAWALDGKLAMPFKYPSLLSRADLTWLYNNGRGRSAADIRAHRGLESPDLLHEFASSGREDSAMDAAWMSRFPSGPKAGAFP
jgi:hypothetical protein